MSQQLPPRFGSRPSPLPQSSAPSLVFSQSRSFSQQDPRHLVSNPDVPPATSGSSCAIESDSSPVQVQGGTPAHAQSTTSTMPNTPQQNQLASTGVNDVQVSKSPQIPGAGMRQQRQPRQPRQIKQQRVTKSVRQKRQQQSQLPNSADSMQEGQLHETPDTLLSVTHGQGTDQGDVAVWDGMGNNINFPSGVVGVSSSVLEQTDVTPTGEAVISGHSQNSLGALGNPIFDEPAISDSLPIQGAVGPNYALGKCRAELGTLVPHLQGDQVNSHQLQQQTTTMGFFGGQRRNNPDASNAGNEIISRSLTAADALPTNGRHPAGVRSSHNRVAGPVKLGDHGVPFCVPLGWKSNVPLRSQAFQVADVARDIMSTNSFGEISDINDLGAEIMHAKTGLSDYTLRVMRFSEEVRKYLRSNALENDWRRLVHTFFEPTATFHLDLCSDSSSNRRETSFSFESISLIFKSKSDAGALDERILMETPREYLDGDSNVIVDCPSAFIVTSYANGMVCADGSLRVYFSRSMKISKWEFFFASHKEFFSRDDLERHNHSAPGVICDEFGLPPNISPLLLIAQGVQSMRPKIQDAVWGILNCTFDGIDSSSVEPVGKGMPNRPNLNVQDKALGRDDFNKSKNDTRSAPHAETQQFKDLSCSQEIASRSPMASVGGNHGLAADSRIAEQYLSKDRSGVQVLSTGNIYQAQQTQAVISSMVMPTRSGEMNSRANDNGIGSNVTDGMNMSDFEGELVKLGQDVQRRHLLSSSPRLAENNKASNPTTNGRQDAMFGASESLSHPIGTGTGNDDNSGMHSRLMMSRDVFPKHMTSQDLMHGHVRSNFDASNSASIPPRAPSSFQNDSERTVARDDMISAAVGGELFPAPSGLTVFQPSDDEGSNNHDIGIGDSQADGFFGGNQSNVMTEHSHSIAYDLRGRDDAAMGPCGIGNARPGLNLFQGNQNGSTHGMQMSATAEATGPGSSTVVPRNNTIKQNTRKNIPPSKIPVGAGNACSESENFPHDESKDERSGESNQSERHSCDDSGLRNQAAKPNSDPTAVKGKAAGKVVHRRGRNLASSSNIPGAATTIEKGGGRRNVGTRKTKSPRDERFNVNSAGGIGPSGSLSGETQSKSRRVSDSPKAKNVDRFPNSPGGISNSMAASGSVSGSGETQKIVAVDRHPESSASGSACDLSTKEPKKINGDGDSKSTVTRDGNESDKQSPVQGQSVGATMAQVNVSKKRKASEHDVSEMRPDGDGSRGDASSRPLIGKGRGRKRVVNGRNGQGTPPTQRRAKAVRQETDG